MISMDLGGKYTIARPGPCVRCGRPTKQRRDADSGELDADPRGVCGMRAAYELIPREHGYDGPRKPLYACWGCFQEDSEGYHATLEIMVKRHGWVKHNATE